ncbi:MAG: 4-(cytidine 5'-diphospho)-2-C-methyl-D-erythritol kinase [Candidatus Omnitrophota bacterium]|nr:4-(cytidine 5'-diphospho)-2-C-methyl-D-erythritol kinase [Candidatus Omnitrophota bacterium]MDZ4242408.1 4-(cytidine 5'-diphospho)-2-C-methyl-D-erythritol kinase [Candidatus Omnitrophota bacterium]
MNRIVLRSPAKLNLILKVLNKRPDGYHNLKTVFERIDLCDDIVLERNSSGKIRILCPDPQVPKGPKNLVYRAARTLQMDCGCRYGVTVRIRKRIPVAAGLAGGSSNAATTLLGLNQIWGLRLSRPKLLDYALRIGSDVPFFLMDCRWALGEGRGEQLTKLNIPTRLWHVLVVPRVKIYTKEVFVRLNLELTKTIDNVNILTQSLINKDYQRMKGLLSNDLESSILAIRPQLAVLKRRLAALNTLDVSFSGSGPSVFGITNCEKDARAIQAILRRKYSRVFVAQTA